MTIRIAGAKISPLQARLIASVERIPPALRRGHPHFYFDHFCLIHAVDVIYRADMAFVSVPDFLASVVAGTVAAHAELETQKQAWRGRTPGHFIRFQDIPLAHRPAIRNLMTFHKAEPGHDRGRHQTSPVQTGGGTVREYDLTANREGRLTIRTLNQRRGYYYSRHHAAATYEYLLITDSAGRPIFGGQPSLFLMRVPVPDW